MTNRKDFPTASGQTSGQKPKTQGLEPDYKRWTGTRERARHRVMGPERRAGPKTNHFQKIKGQKCRSFPHTCGNLFSAIERQQNTE